MNLGDLIHIRFEQVIFIKKYMLKYLKQYCFTIYLYFFIKIYIIYMILVNQVRFGCDTGSGHTQAQVLGFKSDKDIPIYPIYTCISNPHPI